MPSDRRVKTTTPARAALSAKATVGASWQGAKRRTRLRVRYDRGPQAGTCNSFAVGEQQASANLAGATHEEKASIENKQTWKTQTSSAAP